VEFLVEFELTVPEGAPKAEVAERADAEAKAAEKLAVQRHLIRVWKSGAGNVIGLYRAASRSELDAILDALPLAPWMQVSVTALAAHPNDPAAAEPHAGNQLPDPHLTLVYRLEATLAEPLDLGDTAGGRRRIAVQTGGTFTGPGLNGTLLPGASADWQLVLPDGTALGDIRYTLQTDHGDLLYVQSQSIRHGSAEVLARLARGEDVDASEYTFRAATQIETTAPELEWMSKGIFVSVGGRRRGAVLYETYLVA
jgi:muconolactone delta-isomerase